MDEEKLQKMSRSLAHLVFRNGVIEEMHAGTGTQLTDETMKILNKDINNRIYTLLSLLFGDKEKQELLAEMIELNSMYGKSWDKAEISEELQQQISFLMEEKENNR